MALGREGVSLEDARKPISPIGTRTRYSLR